MSAAVADRFLEALAAADKALPGLAAPRRRALERFQELGFPTTAQEEWRFTRLDAIAEGVFALAPASEPDPALLGLRLARLEGPRLAFVDGRFAPGLSSEDLPEGLSAGSLRGRPELAEPQLSRGGAFAALNAALFEDGAFVRLERGVRLQAPIHLLFLSTARGGTMAHTRVVVDAGEGSRAELVEEHAAAGPGTYFSNVVVDVTAGAGSRLELVKLQREGEGGLHVAGLRARLARDSSFVCHSVSLGGRLTRDDVEASLEGEGAECELNGLYLAGGSRHVDNRVVVDHVKPHGTSRQLYKGVLDGRARAVFNGSVEVRPAASQANATVYNRNLLLSPDALVNTKPDFKIFNNDVQCRHGATVGQLSADALFYLRSRGLSAEDARRLLVFAFASEMVGRLAPGKVKDALGELLRERLPGSDHA